MSKTLEKDILLICKGYYNKEKYKSILDAFNAYYHREYGCEDITMDERFAVNLFLKPCVKEFLKEREINLFCELYLFQQSNELLRKTIRLIGKQIYRRNSIWS